MIAGWDTYTINECCDILDSQRVPLNAEQRAKIPGSIPYYGANGVQGYINHYLFDEDLILMAEDGGNFDQFATRPIAYKISGKSWVNNHAHILRAKTEFSQDFIFYSVVHKNILYFIQGGTRSKLNQSDLKSITLEIPKSKKEQSTIATILTTVDQAIEKTEQLIAKYERIKTGLMQDLLTRGIDEEGNIRSEETHEFKDSELGRIPVEWNVNTLSYYTNAIGDGIHATPKYTDTSPYFFINGNNLINGKIQITENTSCVSEGEYRSYYIAMTSDTILMSINGTIGNLAIYNGEKVILGKSACFMNFKKTEFMQFTYFLLQTEKIKYYFENELTGTTIKNLSLKAIRNTPIAMPGIEELKRINIFLADLEKSLHSEKEQLYKLNKQKTGLMQDLLTGKVRVDALMNKVQETI